jgi:thiosulfate/3-mercaptopyruvate sulfurtransferase
MTSLPLLIEPDALEPRLGEPGLLVVDLSKPELYGRMHLPGAVHLDYARIVTSQPPVMGLLPDATSISRVFSDIGLRPETHVVAYDDEGGGRAARLLWTLAAYGHTTYSLLNGGLHAWANEGHTLSHEPVEPTPTDYRAEYKGDVVASREEIQAALGSPELKLLDTRSPKEFNGSDKRAHRAGHIPGAVNLDWTLFMDPQRNLRLKPERDLRGMLAEKGIGPEDQVVTYCQTHHRSAHTWLVLSHLGMPRPRGYPGAWSDWGNREDTPVE